jgi:phosphoribosylamine--glycine ligase
MKILVVGGGGREHALAWKLAQSERVERVYVAPGNAGTARESGVENVPVAATDIPALVDFARDEAVDLTVVGPEAPLVAGIVDDFRLAGLRCFGPSQDAARLEGSKSFAKAFMERHYIPTGGYRDFVDAEAAEAYIHEVGAPLVVKADGLAAGKGVVIADTDELAVETVRAMLAGSAHGEAGSRVVIEELLEGEEASFIVMADGTHVLSMATSQDHKARDDGDAGPNTGGMGAYTPAPVVTPEMEQRIMDRVILPTLKGMADEGHPYTGFLYAGLMIGADGEPRVLEYNCRFGDPETQPILLRLRSDLAELCEAALEGRLDRVEARWDPRAALGVVLAAEGYPSGYRTGEPILGLDHTLADCKVFHAGTKLEAGQVVTNGGRVLCVCALGDSVSEAQRLAYRQVERLHWQGMYYRRDIGYRALQREQGGDEQQ